MNIYSSRTPSHVFRKIYEDHFGPIPKDNDGRSYDIHHLDGDHSNNHPSNLKAVTIQEHYDIHYAQGDYYACYLMAIQRMNKSPKEISKLSKAVQLDRVKNGSHPWQRRLDGTSQATDKVISGKHNFLRRPDGTSLALDRAKNGTSPFLGASVNQKMLSAGKHSSQIIKTCPHCDKTVSAGPFAKYHGDKCKKKTP